MLNRDIISEIYSYLDCSNFTALSLVNKLFFQVSLNALTMEPLYDKFNYSKKRNRRFGRNYVNHALEICTQMMEIIEEKHAIVHNAMTTSLPELSNTQIIEEYFSLDKNTHTGHIEQRDATVIGFRNPKLAMTTRDPLDVNNINFDLVVMLLINNNGNGNGMIMTYRELSALIINTLPLKYYVNKSKINDEWYHEIPLQLPIDSPNNWYPLRKDLKFQIRIKNLKYRRKISDICIAADMIRSTGDELMKMRIVYRFNDLTCVTWTPILQIDETLQYEFYQYFYEIPESYHFCFSRNQQIIPSKFSRMHFIISDKKNINEPVVIFPYEIIDQPYPYWYRIPLISQRKSEMGPYFYSKQYYYLTIRIDNLDCGYNLIYNNKPYGRQNVNSPKIIHFNLFFRYDRPIDVQ
jgi:hypothetical protein